MKIANGRSEYLISFVREPKVHLWIAGNTVPSHSNMEGVTTKMEQS